MQTLELKIPPPAITALIAAAMWGISLFAPSLEVPGLIRAVVALALATTGIGISVAGVISFRRAKTTVNPMKPEATSALVTSGIYRLSRNPMYVGIVLTLIAWTVYLSSVWTLSGPLAFVLYITRFQIIPEERALATMFGATFAEYRSAVRRWL